jgi:stage IV sporulation protein FB
VFFEPAHTAFDVNFTLFGTHVRVHPAHWLVAAFLGADFFQLGFQFLVVWVLCVFVSVLVHEFGHIMVGRFFGSHGHIVLYSFGGLAIQSDIVENRWQHIAVCFGGPAAGFILGGLVYLANALKLIPSSSNLQTQLLIEIAIESLLWINISWGIVNLLPIFPLDGGQISKDLCEWFSPRRGFSYCLKLSICVALMFAVHNLLSYFYYRSHGSWNYPLTFIPSGGVFAAVFFGALAAGSYQMLQANQRHTDHWDDEGWDDWHQRR